MKVVLPLPVHEISWPWNVYKVVQNASYAVVQLSMLLTQCSRECSRAFRYCLGTDTCMSSSTCDMMCVCVCVCACVCVCVCVCCLYVNILECMCYFDL